MSVASMAVAEVLYSRLSGTATVAGSALYALVAGRIYEDAAPQGAAMPYVVFQMMSSTDTHGAVRLVNDSLWQVQGVAQGATYAAAGSIASHIDTLLQDFTGTASTAGMSVQLRRADEVRYTEQAQAQGALVQYRHLGGIYRATTG